MATDQKNISAEAVKEIKALFHHAPQKKNVGIDALKIVQEYNGWVSDDALKEVAEMCEMTYHELDSVATFYNIIFRRPVGRNVIMICDSVTCWIVGYKEILKGLKDRLGIGLGETTEDDRFTLLPFPCLGNCDKAPTFLVNKDLYEHVEVDQLDEILKKYE